MTTLSSAQALKVHTQVLKEFPDYDYFDVGIMPHGVYEVSVWKCTYPSAKKHYLGRVPLTRSSIGI